MITKCEKACPIICPVCGKENEDDWIVIVDGEMKDGGCQDCWEAQCDESWWNMVTAFSQAIHGTAVDE